MIHLPTDFLDLLRLLNEEKVDHIVIGGYAVIYHGYPRTTKDIDIWISPDEASQSGLKRALRTFGFSAQSLESPVFAGAPIVTFGVEPFRVDLFSQVSGLTFHECLERAEITTIDGVSTRMLSLGDLRKAKQASGRLHDLADLSKLRTQ